MVFFSIGRSVLLNILGLLHFVRMCFDPNVLCRLSSLWIFAKKTFAKIEFSSRDFFAKKSNQSHPCSAKEINEKKT
jgi:hypothetical protein